MYKKYLIFTLFVCLSAASFAAPWQWVGPRAMAMGGAGVAFGASFDEEESNAHQANECINVEQFKLHAQICLEAMYRMITAD